MSHEKLDQVKKLVGPDATYDRAAKTIGEMSTSNDFAEFLILPLYEEIWIDLPLIHFGASANTSPASAGFF